MDKELRKNTRTRWLQSLFEFAHSEYQRRLWTEADYPESVGDFSEAIGQYFDDLNLHEGYDWFFRQGFVSEKEASIFRDFHDALKEYITSPEKISLSDKKVLKDIEWKMITQDAKAGWEKLKLVITDQAELNYMVYLENQYLTKGS